MSYFFASDHIKDKIKNAMKIIRNTKESNDFEKQQNVFLQRILSLIYYNASQCDEQSPYCIEHYEKDIKEILNSVGSDLFDAEGLLVTLSFFIIEFSINDSPASPVSQDLTSEVECFILKNINKFRPENSDKINIHYKKLPILIAKYYFSMPETLEYKSALSTLNKAKKINDELLVDLKSKESKVIELSEALKGHESNFNFVGLYDGFFRLGIIKERELVVARTMLILMGALVLLPFAYEYWYLSVHVNIFQTPIEGRESLNAGINYSAIIIRAMPILSLSIIFIYYFRILLANYNSIKTQIIQIELRKSLCCFIQSYADYAKEINKDSDEKKSSTLLSKFEDVIFSNIVTKASEMPAVFDGMDKVANIIKSFKG